MRLIDADALYQEVIGSREDNRQTESMARAMHKYLHNHFLTMIGHAPSVDAVAVVRCKECKYWGSPTENQEAICRHWSSYYGTIRTMDYQYCSCGERREK